MEDKALTESQKSRIQNLDSLQWGISLIGNIVGIVYASRTGGGFWRYVGYFFLGGLIFGVIAALFTIPAKNNIIKEG